MRDRIKPRQAYGLTTSVLDRPVHTCKAQAQGFKDYVQSGIVLQVANNIPQNITLHVGAVPETVEVQTTQNGTNFSNPSTNRSDSTTVPSTASGTGLHGLSLAPRLTGAVSRFPAVSLISR